jgi:cysteine-rich repeat protein
MNTIGSVTQLSSADPRVIVVHIINIALGVIGTIMVALMVYAGFLWMTSGGDEEKVGTAKKIIRNAIIGVVIILLSWAITYFVLRALMGISNGGGSGGSDGNFNNDFGGGGGFSSFSVRSINPSGSMLLQNITVRLIFSDSVDASTVSSTISVVPVAGGSPVVGTFTVSGNLVEFRPSALCPGFTPDSLVKRYCFEKDTDYHVMVGGSLRSQGGSRIVCGGFHPSCESFFRSGNIVDVTGPSVTIYEPFEGQNLPVDDVIRISTGAIDDTGVSYIESHADGRYVDRDGPTVSTTPLMFEGHVFWNTTGVATGTHVLQSFGFDVDDNSSTSTEVHPMLRPRHCFNGVPDGGENDLDHGGPDCGGPDCGACAGGLCTTGAQCASGICDHGLCVEKPMITGFDPVDGKPGTFVTIRGVNFGRNPGHVYFTNKVEAFPPAVCARFENWTQRQVVVEVPNGAISGPLSIVNASSSLSDATNDDNGPRLRDFAVNTSTHPGLCAADPGFGQISTLVHLNGAGLGTTPGPVDFNTDHIVTTFSSWGNALIDLLSPVAPPGTYDVKAHVGTQQTNTITYSIQPPAVSGAPQIESLDPGSGPIAQYVTIQGHNFGDTPGQVYFYRLDKGFGSADMAFPAACERDNAFWRPTRIIMKVPNRIGGLAAGGENLVDAGTYQVYIRRHDDAVESNKVNFAVIAGEAGPGVCAIVPAVGPVGTHVSLYGEKFGSSPPGRSKFAAQDPAGVFATEYNLWNTGEIGTRVPNAGKTGNVIAVTETTSSNPALFTVRHCAEDRTLCTSHEKCCENIGICIASASQCPDVPGTAMYAWRLSTGDLPLNPEVVEECEPPTRRQPSPTPWNRRSGGSQVCVNADIQTRMTTPILPASVTTDTFVVRKCPTQDGDCSHGTTVLGYRGSPTAAHPATDFQGLIHFTPLHQWEASSTYEVVLKTGIQSPAGLHMLENAERCGQGNAYCFRFTTRDSLEACRVGSALVNPDPHTFTDLAQDQDVVSTPLSAEDQCLVLNPWGYDWRWSTTDDRITVTRDPQPTDAAHPERATWGSPEQIATSRQETGAEAVGVQAAVTDAGHSTTGTASMYVNMVPPRIIEKGPDCQEACVNAAIWAKFNVSMNTDSFDNPDGTKKMVIKHCTTENCRQFDREWQVDSSWDVQWRMDSVEAGGPQIPNLKVVIQQPGILAEGQFYKVYFQSSVTSPILSRTNMALVGLNDPEGYSWTFKTKIGDQARCAVDHLNVTPVSKVENAVGARQMFAGDPFGAPDACSQQGQLLVVDRSFDSWIPADIDVAQFLNGATEGLGRLSLKSLPPAAGCNNKCVRLGSDGVEGQVAKCGDGVVQTTDPNYCLGAHARDGQGLSIYNDGCRLMDPATGAGEECDTTNPDDTLCDPRTCLWKGVRPVAEGGTCGDGHLNRGEQCDPLVCRDGVNAGRSCTTNATCPGSVCQIVPNTFGCSDHCKWIGGQAFSALDPRNVGLCGNGLRGDGEACDDGNHLNSDGCSLNCLHEGSGQKRAVCGNGALEAGEACEISHGMWPPGCDHVTCLHTGAPICPAGVSHPRNCCGDGNPNEIGKECEVGQEGCTARCLLAGASQTYSTPSFCGDGIVGTGEDRVCEPSRTSNPSASFISNMQLAQITGNRDPRPEEHNLMMTALTARYQGKDGSAQYGLQCGNTMESQCRLAGYGLTAGGCCALRPVATPIYPTDGSQWICRNTLISLRFNVAVDKNSLDQNFFLAKQFVDVDRCPSGTLRLDQEPLAQGWFNKIADAWHRAVRWVLGEPTYAQAWCVGSAPGKLTVIPDGIGSIVNFAVTDALDATTTYKIILRGESNLAAATRHGIRSARGVVMSGTTMSGTTEIVFKTGMKICEANNVDVRDMNREHPYLFNVHPETHQFIGMIQSIQNGVAVPIVSVNQYRWAWNPWSSSKTDVLRTEGGSSSDDLSTTNVSEQNKNGNTFITAGIHITVDDVNIPSTSGTAAFETSRNVHVMLCQNPWPSLTLAPFADTKPMPHQASALHELVPAFEGGPYYNFSTMYCLDGVDASSTADDLPGALITGVPPTADDLRLGLLRQYLFTFESSSTNSGDGIGIRIYSNPMHMSPIGWYRAHAFAGTPTGMMIDGYDAIKDGTTVYAVARNLDSVRGGPVTSTMYVFSYNPDAKAATATIFKQMMDNLTFNVNLSEDVANKCYEGPGRPVVSASFQTVECTADFECASYGAEAHCASFKDKMQRDIVRFRDFEKMTAAIERSKATAGKYPMLASGTFIQGITNSLWGSWNTALGSAVGGGSGSSATTFPQDPVNRFLTCGRCRGADGNLGKPCMDRSECAVGQTCVPQVSTDLTSDQNGYDPATCWNATSSRYFCPKVSDPQVSRLYQYRELSAGNAYELGMELEGPSSTRYDPPLVRGSLKRCTNTEQGCQQTSDCRIMDSLGRRVISDGQCVVIGGSWVYNGICTNATFGTNNICGDHIVGPTEICELDQHHPMACDAMLNGVRVNGTKIQICNACQEWTDGPQTVCVPDVQCGNGRVDPGEACDDGTMNGRYGYCGRDCSGVGASCGDHMLSMGEHCDNGTPNGDNGNGDYCSATCNLTASCSIDCQGLAPHCGDDVVNGTEQCDGSNQSTATAICHATNPTQQVPCRTETAAQDCGAGIACGAGGTDAAFDDCASHPAFMCAGGSRDGSECCPGSTVNATSGQCNGGSRSGLEACPLGRCLSYPTRHTRNCFGPGHASMDSDGVTATQNQCTWDAWTSCMPTGSCGDGTVDTGEQCDDGNRNNNDGCTNACKQNICGDGVMNVSVEDCDMGLRNGQSCTGAEYGSTCLACSATCHAMTGSGGYCGDGIKNGAEQCDRTSGTAGLTCQGLGYDYAKQLMCRHYAFMTDAAGAIQCVYWGSTMTGTGAASRCSLTTTPAGMPEHPNCLSSRGVYCDDICDAIDQPPAESGSLSICSAHHSDWTYHAFSGAPALIDYAWKNDVCVGGAIDAVMCTPQCGFTGCARCAETGTGVLTGQVMDAVYFTTSTPGARVTLKNNGNRIGEVFTDQEGRFRFEHLNNNPSCGNYQVIVESSTDNPHTPPDESKNSGYWPYESVGTNLDNFPSIGIQNLDGKIFLIPRVGVGETLAIFTWNGSLSGYIDAHLALPQSMTYQGGQPQPNPWAACSPPVETDMCTRDISWESRQGDVNVDSVPHAHLYCFHEGASFSDESCGSFSIAPETIKYKRGSWSSDGAFNYALVNYSNIPNFVDYLRSIGAKVRIVTRDRFYTVSPPATNPTSSCGPGMKYWHVFRQDARTGTITIPGGGTSGLFQCTGDRLDDGELTPLPNPFRGVGG